MRLIITRPEPDASRTAEALSRLGHQPILSPMLDVVLEPDAPIPDRRYRAVLVTSSNAVRALAAHKQRARLQAVPLLAVGDHTAVQAKRAGFDARSAGGALDDLLGRVAQDLMPADGPLLYAAGEAQAGDLAGRLRGIGFQADVALVYRAEPRTHLAPAAAAALRRRQADGVLLYSRRSAEAFAAALKAEGLAPLAAEITCFCLSQRVAEPLAELSSGRILVAARPDQLSLFGLVEGDGRERHALPASARSPDAQR
ncbi:MAG TPA: uroporphyrinogen-III synthase [Propylenella sp.]|nr:uroporphyrinogen-III synthase [Propylenella sp.]